MAQHIAQKLRLTSALLGTASRKDLAAAFRAINPNTAFDLGRADKWLQGRARPRQMSVYDDWARLLGLEQPGTFIAESDLPAFTAALAARHGIDGAELERRAGIHLEAAGHEERGLGSGLAGTYACYSCAWSPYYRGQLIRGRFSIEAGPGAHGLVASYREALPTGPLQFAGPVTPARRGLYVHLKEVGGDSQFFFCLFPQTQPVSVLGGYMCGSAVIGPEPQPSLTRILLVRLRDATSGAGTWGGYLPPGGSVAADLAALGIVLDHPDAVDRQLGQFFGANGGGGGSQISPSEFRAILDVFDRHWLNRQNGPASS